MKRTNTKQSKRKSTSKRRVSKQSKRKTTKRRKTKRTSKNKKGGARNGDWNGRGKRRKERERLAREAEDRERLAGEEQLPPPNEETIVSQPGQAPMSLYGNRF